MTAVAEIRVRDRRGVFVAETCEIKRGVVTARGRMRERGGLNFAETRWSKPQVLSWPVSRLVEIKWIH